MKVKSENEVAQFCLLLETPWTVAYQTPLSMGFSRQESWSGVPFPPPGDLPDSGMDPTSPAPPALGRRILYHWAIGEAPPKCLAKGYSLLNVVD